MVEYDERYYSRGMDSGALGSCAARIAAVTQVRHINARVRPGKMLEIGCGDGSFLEAMAGKGWDALGLDISETAVRMARSRRDIRVEAGELGECALADSTFDLVVMRHVLEHIPDPVETLKEIRRVLLPGGLLYMTVPNIASIESRIAGDSWFHLDPPYHLTHFSPASITEALVSAGFREIRVNHMTHEYRQTLTYGILSRTGLEGLRADGGRAPLLRRLVLYSILPLGVILSYACSLAGRGGTIQVTAWK